MRLIFLHVFVLISSVLLHQSTSSDLLSVVVVYRHGFRTPTKFAPLDPYKEPKFWPNGNGELTNLGIKQQFELGQWIRRRYANFLPEIFNKSDTYVRSSSVDRCLMSAAANLAGLYPPKGDQIWNQDLLWRPLPVHSVPMNEDTILEMASICPRYEEIYQEILDSEVFKKIDKQNADLYLYLIQHLGVTIKRFSDIDQWYDTLTIEELSGFVLPEWTKMVYPDKMKVWSDLAFQIATNNTQLARFGVGPFFETLAVHLKAVLENSNDLLAKKMVLFSGHKTNICDITNTLGTFRSADYASALFIELRNMTKPFLNIIYRTANSMEYLKIQNCGVDCDLSKFFEIIEPLRINDTQVKEECSPRNKL